MCWVDLLQIFICYKLHDENLVSNKLDYSISKCMLTIIGLPLTQQIYNMVLIVIIVRNRMRERNNIYSYLNEKMHKTLRSGFPK